MLRSKRWLQVTSALKYPAYIGAARCANGHVHGQLISEPMRRSFGLGSGELRGECGHPSRHNERRPQVVLTVTANKAFSSQLIFFNFIITLFMFMMRQHFVISVLFFDLFGERTSL